MKIIVATRNKGKLREFRVLFRGSGHAIAALPEGGNIPKVRETGRTYAENAVLKAEAICRVLGVPVMADDSGIEIDHLGGRPGVYSARYAGSPTDDRRNNAKLLRALKGVPPKGRGASFVCCLALAIPGSRTRTVHGVLRGRILEEERGNLGFGYDPLFHVRSLKKTLAEMAPALKNRTSHRARAARKMIELIKKLKDDLPAGRQEAES